MNYALSICLAVLPLVGQSVTPLTEGATRPIPSGLGPFSRAMYSLRATRTQGSSLVLLDATGGETVVHTDARFAKAKGFISGTAHASHYGAFSCTPDLNKAVFTVFGDPVQPSATGGGFGMGGMSFAFAVQGTFGEWDFEGLHVWNRATGKSECLADPDQLKAIGKAWFKTKEGQPFRDAPYLHKDVKTNCPSAFYLLGGQRFLWITRSYVVQVDLETKEIKPLWAFKDQDAMELEHASLRSWQEADGTVHAFRDNHFLTIGTDGSCKDERWMPLIKSASGERYSWKAHRPESVLLSWPERAALFSDGSMCMRVEALPEGGWKPVAQWELDHSRILVNRSATRYFAYNHYKLKHDTLTCVDPSGKLQWVTDLGDCRNEINLQEGEGQLFALVLRVTPGSDTYTRLAINPATGKVASSTPWGVEDAGTSEDAVAKVPASLEDFACLIPAGEDFLVWLPASGEVENGLKASGWEAKVEARPTFRNPSYGTWARLNARGELAPLARRAYADQMVVVGTRPVPLPLSANTGMSIGKGVDAPSIPGSGPTVGGLKSNWMGAGLARTAPYPFGRFRQVPSKPLSDFAAQWIQAMPPVPASPQ